MRLRSILLAAIFSLCVFAHADSLVLVGEGATLGTLGEAYAYEVEPNIPHELLFVPGNTVTLTGLANVTGASIGGSDYQGYFLSSYTANSVTFTDAVGIGFTGGPNYYNYPLVFEVYSTSTNVGTVDFSLKYSYFIPDYNFFYEYPFSSYYITYPITGTTEGPVAPLATTPELSSLNLVGSGLVGFAGLLRKRYAARAGSHEIYASQDQLG